MTVQTFREFLSKEPFQPFRLVMSSGQAYDVPRREMAFLTRTSLIGGIGDPGNGVPEEFKICSLTHISAVEPMNPPSTG